MKVTLLLTLLSTAFAFYYPYVGFRSIRISSSPTNRPNYKELLEKAKAEKKAEGGYLTGKEIEQSVPKSSLPTARDMINSPRDKPFDEDTYDEIQRAVQILSDRVRTKEPLKPGDFTLFEKAVDTIIRESTNL